MIWVQRSAAVRSARGFTLMEMMIAMALVGMALTIAFAALRFASRSWERTDVLGNELDQWRVATSVIRRQLNQAQAIRPDAASRNLLFTGASHTLEFIAPAPVQNGRLAGLYRYRLHFVNEAQGKALRLDYRPYFPADDSAWQTDAETTLLVKGVQEGRFAYLAESPISGEGQWQDAWSKAERLPTMVRLELQLEAPSAPWPPLVVQLLVTGGAR